MAASHGNLIDLSKTLSFFLSIFTIIGTDKLPAKLHQCYLGNFRFFKTPVRILTNLTNRKLHFSETVSCIDTEFVLGLGTPRWGRCLAGSEYHYLLMKDHFNLGVPPAPVNPPPLKKKDYTLIAHPVCKSNEFSVSMGRALSELLVNLHSSRAWTGWRLLSSLLKWTKEHLLCFDRSWDFLKAEAAVQSK